MLQPDIHRNAARQTCLRLLTPFLYLCLILSLTGYESGFHAAPGASPTSGQTGTYTGFDLDRDDVSHRLPSLVAPVAKLPSGARVRLDSREDDLPPAQPFWAVTGDPPRLSALRIDPIAWDCETPSFLLPSAHGLVPFAIPPPFRLA